MVCESCAVYTFYIKQGIIGSIPPENITRVGKVNRHTCCRCTVIGNIETIAALKNISSGPTDQRIIIITTDQRIIASTSLKKIVTTKSG